MMIPKVLLLVPREAQDGLLRAISAAGWPARAYPHAHGFLRQYRPRPRQCLILDLDLPGKQALPLLEKLADQDPELEVIVLGSSEVDDAVAAMRRGALQYVQKPFLDQDLVQELSNLFEV